MRDLAFLVEAQAVDTRAGDLARRRADFVYAVDAHIAGQLVVIIRVQVCLHRSIVAEQVRQVIAPAGAAEPSDDRCGVVAVVVCVCGHLPSCDGDAVCCWSRVYETGIALSPIARSRSR